MQQIIEKRRQQTENLDKRLHQLLKIQENSSVYFVKKPATVLSIFSDASRFITDPDHLNQEFDMLQMGLLVLGLAQYQSQDQNGQYVPTYLTYQHKQLDPNPGYPELLDLIAFQGCSVIFSSTSCRYRLSDRDTVHKVQIALKIGLYILNGSLVINKDMLSHILETHFSDLTTLPELKKMVTDFTISTTYVSPECLSRLVLDTRDHDIIEKNFHDALDLCQEEEYAEFKQALQAWMEDSLEKLKLATTEYRNIYALAAVAVKSFCTKLNDFRIETLHDFVREADYYNYIPSDGFAAVQKQAQSILNKRAQLGEKRNALAQTMAEQSLVRPIPENVILEKDYISYYAYEFIKGLKSLHTEAQLETEFKMFQIGLLILKLSQHSSMIPYIHIQGQCIAPNQTTLLAISPEFGTTPLHDFNHQANPLRDRAALIMLIGKKVMNGSLAVDKAALFANIEKVAEFQPDISALKTAIEHLEMAPVPSAIADDLISSAHYRLESSFERAIAYCKTPERQALAEAITGLMAATLTAYQHADNLTSALNLSDAFHIASTIESLVKKETPLAVIQSQLQSDEIQNIRMKMHKEATVIFYLDLVIQAFIGLCVGAAIGATLGAIGTGLVVGSLVGMASTRFGMWHAKEYQISKNVETQIENCIRATC